MTRELDGRTVIVTGASRGIGKARGGIRVRVDVAVSTGAIRIAVVG